VSVCGRGPSVLRTRQPVALNADLLLKYRGSKAGLGRILRSFSLARPTIRIKRSKKSDTSRLSLAAIGEVRQALAKLGISEISESILPIFLADRGEFAYGQARDRQLNPNVAEIFGLETLRCPV